MRIPQWLGTPSHKTLSLTATLVAFASFSLLGCEASEFEDGVRKTVQDRLVARAEQGKKELDELLNDRDKTIKLKLDELGLGSLDWDPETKHPLVKWREGLNAADADGEDGVIEVLEGRSKKYPGTDLEKDIPKVKTYFQSNNKYWKDPANASNDEYYAFLEGYRKEVSERDQESNEFFGRFVDDALFDEVFVHARRSFELYKIKPENRVTSVFRYWQTAFNFPSLSGEAFMPYIARLCESSDDFQTFCRKIPFEFRHMAIMNPYYDVLIGKLDKIVKEFPESPYRPAVDYLIATFKADQEKMAKEFEEYPILANSMAFLPANQRLNAVIGPRGFFMGNRPIEVPEEGSDKEFQLTNAKSKALEESFVATLKEIRETGEPELRQGQIGILADNNTPTGAVLRLAWAPMLIPEEEQSQLNLGVFLIGRRRFDFSNLKVANRLLLMPKTDPLELKVTHPSGSANCKMMGLTGERAIQMPAPMGYVHVKADGTVVAGAYALPAEEGQEAPPQPAPSITTKVGELNWKQLSDWARDIPGGISFMVDPNAPWDSFINVLGPLAFQCKDDKCEKSEPRTQPSIYVGYCN